MKPPRVRSGHWSRFGRAFESHDIGGQLDASGRYRLPFPREFPLSIRLFHYRAGRFTQGVTWHEQLEVFCPVSGTIDVQMGEHLVHLEAGDVLVMQNLEFHHVVNRAALDCRAVVVSFLPELVYTLGSSSHDFAFLLPFYERGGGDPRVLRRTEPDARAAREALVQLVREFTAVPGDAHREAACKARLLAFLLVLVRRFHQADAVRWQFERQRRLAQRLGPLIEHLQQPHAERLSAAAAARTSGMSRSQFSRAFRTVAGMPYLAYLTRVRLAEAARLLRLGDLKIAEIAGLTGFSDQSHFDRRFKRAFGQTPRDFQKSYRTPR